MESIHTNFNNLIKKIMQWIFQVFDRILCQEKDDIEKTVSQGKAEGKDA